MGLRLACGTTQIAELVRQRFEDALVEQEMPLGFVVRTPHGRQRLYLLTDRCGFVLARSRHADDIARSLCAHLRGFVGPAPGQLLLRGRSILRDGTVKLCLLPLGYMHPVVERRLASAGGAVIDRLGIVVDEHGMLDLGNAEHSDEWPGHVSRRAHGAQLSEILYPGPSITPTVAGVTTALAREAVGGTRAATLRVCARLASAVSVRVVDVGDENYYLR